MYWGQAWQNINTVQNFPPRYSGIAPFQCKYYYVLLTSLPGYLYSGNSHSWLYSSLVLELSGRVLNEILTHYVSPATSFSSQAPGILAIVFFCELIALSVQLLQFLLFPWGEPYLTCPWGPAIGCFLDNALGTDPGCGRLQTESCLHRPRILWSLSPL